MPGPYALLLRHVRLVAVTAAACIPTGTAVSAYEVWDGNWLPNHYAYWRFGPSMGAEWSVPVAAAAGTWSTSGAMFHFWWDAQTGNDERDNTWRMADLGWNGGTGGILAYTRGEVNLQGDLIRAYTYCNSNPNVPWGAGEPGTFDRESVAAHEFGHWLQLGHSTDTSAVMYPSIAAGEVRHNLALDDIYGIMAIYG